MESRPPQNNATVPIIIMRFNPAGPGRFSGRVMVGCEQSLPPVSGNRPTAILETGSWRSKPQPLAPGWVAAIARARNRLISAPSCRARSGPWGLSMRPANRSAAAQTMLLPGQRHDAACRRQATAIKTVPTGSSQIGDRVGNGRVTATLAGKVPRRQRVPLRQSNPG